MDRVSFALFATAVGACGVAWRDGGLVGVALPQGSEDRTRRHLRRRFPEASEIAPPPDVAMAIALITALLAGETADLGAIALEMSGVGEFEREVYAVARSIPPGETLTYGEIAGRLGTPGAARAVGRALGANPFPIVVPCHRVLGAAGAIGGFSAHGGADTKARLLSIEKARTSDAPLLFDDLAVSIRPGGGRS